eukprot:gb/GECH01000719.1/.p1 GENE.gb/GECH01000719.1/~~gb/GECH01000719.1/.p1  ORF type:complete len:603 (+),score=153.78 gb/GECH01000719.1/:1-1809(+)
MIENKQLLKSISEAINRLDQSNYNDITKASLNEKLRHIEEKDLQGLDPLTVHRIKKELQKLFPDEQNNEYINFNDYEEHQDKFTKLLASRHKTDRSISEAASKKPELISSVQNFPNRKIKKPKQDTISHHDQEPEENPSQYDGKLDDILQELISQKMELKNLKEREGNRVQNTNKREAKKPKRKRRKNNYNGGTVKGLLHTCNTFWRGRRDALRAVHCKACNQMAGFSHPKKPPRQKKLRKKNPQKYKSKNVSTESINGNDELSTRSSIESENSDNVDNDLADRLKNVLNLLKNNSQEHDQYEKTEKPLSSRVDRAVSIDDDGQYIENPNNPGSNKLEVSFTVERSPQGKNNSNDTTSIMSPRVFNSEDDRNQKIESKDAVEDKSSDQSSVQSNDNESLKKELYSKSQRARRPNTTSGWVEVHDIHAPNPNEPMEECNLDQRENQPPTLDNFTNYNDYYSTYGQPKFEIESLDDRTSFNNYPEQYRYSDYDSQSANEEDLSHLLEHVSRNKKQHQIHQKNIDGEGRNRFEMELRKSDHLRKKYIKAWLKEQERKTHRRATKLDKILKKQGPKLSREKDYSKRLKILKKQNKILKEGLQILKS